MHGTPPRRKPSGLRRLSSFAAGHRILAVTAAGCTIALLGGGVATAATVALSDRQVGTQYSDGQVVASGQTIQ